MPDILEQIIRQLLTSDSELSDGVDSIAYHACGKMLLDKTSVIRDVIVDALPITNKLPDAIQIISHFVNQQNFLVLNGHLTKTHSPENLPTFCQDIIVSHPFDRHNHRTVSAFTECHKNPFFCRQRNPFKNKHASLILRTSGTTGQPKFVVHDHTRVLQNAKSVSGKLQLSPHDRVLITSPLHHSYGLVTAFLPSLLAGSSIRFISNTNIIILLEAIRSFQPTVMYSTPGVIEMLTKFKTSFKIPKVTITAGDRIREDVFLRYEKTVGTILNLYGSTEMGAMATSPPHEPVDYRSKGLMEPLPGIALATKSKSQNRPSTILCKNAFGYLHYLDAAGKTMRSTKSEWFDTKDLGRMTDQAIKVLGRSDHKINRNGVLLSYFEIENTMELICPELQHAIVVKLPTENIIGTQFVAVCQLKENTPISETQIRKRCLDKLTRGMVPDAIEFVETMPLLPNGKINRSLLHSRFNASAILQSEHV